MEILLTVIVVEHLASPGKQRLDVFPNPRGPITNHTKPDLILWNHTRLFDLLESLAKLCLVLHLRSGDGLWVRHRSDKPKALGISPLAMPRGASGPRVPLPSLALPTGRVGTYAPSMPSTTTGRHPVAIASMRRAASRDGATSKTVTLGGLMHKRMEALTAQCHPGKVAEQRLRLLIGHLDRHLGRRLLHIELCAPWR